MRKQLEKKYDELFINNGIERPLDTDIIDSVIRNSLESFLKDSKKPAIYCNGEHTMMLMSDYMFYLKKVKYVVDNFCAIENIANTGFEIIRSNEIEEKGIDAIIISSFKFKESIHIELDKNHPELKVLDIYSEFKKRGINLQYDYYRYGHPFHYYKTLNILQNEYDECEQSERLEKVKKIVAEYIKIKNFGQAYRWACIGVNESQQSIEWKKLAKDIAEINMLVEKACLQVNENNVLMLCLDGFRRKDFCKAIIPKIYSQIDKEWIYYENAYSYSTSTLESLIPVYGENSNQNTNYDAKSTVDEKDCRFIKKAIEQNRRVFFYTDIEHYIKSEHIKRTDRFLTLTEKIWEFLLESVDIDNGLFYIHSLYESHYSFANPYTRGKMISEGTALLFDYLPQKGMALRTDYVSQQKDSMRYIDDVLAGVLERLNCKIVLFADHGNLILEEGTKLEDIPREKLLAAEELIQIPMAIKCGKDKGRKIQTLHSLMNINKTIIELLNDEYSITDSVGYIKIGRTEIYNPDFRMLYKKVGCEEQLLAFEGFIFEEGYKLIIYSSGKVELYNLQDEIINDNEKRKLFLNKIRKLVTVVDL